MAVGAVIENGKVVETAADSAKKANNNSGMDKDAFLQLLVAQMKYQDPLEPTSNTEYISQYATFSQVEQMQNMANTMELTRASNMVGKLVEVQTTNASGETSVVEGIVQYVAYENGKAYVVIDDVPYSVDDVTAIIDETYQNAVDVATAFAVAMNQLPSIYNLTLDHKDMIDRLQEAFNGMSSYQQSFVANEYVEKLRKYVERMAQLVEAAEAQNDAESEDADQVAGEAGAGQVQGTEQAEGSEGEVEDESE